VKLGKLFDRARNPDGTYDGAKALADFTGGLISEAEIRWTFDRLKHLMHVEGKTKAEAKAIAAEEAKTKPWEPRT
jgi:hypothetical protein